MRGFEKDLIFGTTPPFNGAGKVASPREALMSDMKLPLHQRFFPLGYAFEILTNEPAVLSAAEESFGHLGCLRESAPLRVGIGVSEAPGANCPPEPTRRQYSHLYSLVADASNQALLDFKTCTGFAWLTTAAIANSLYFRHNFLEKIVYLLLGSSVVTDLHAACVSKDGKGILLCGNSGAGKSTLSYACARAGWTYTSDDTSYLINDAKLPRVIGHAHRVRFRPAARALFPELERRTLTQRLEGKPSIEVPVSELPVRHSAIEARVDAVVFLNRYSGAPETFVSLSAGSATRRICRELYSSGEIRAAHERVLQKFWDVPAFELHYSDLQAGIQALECLADSL